MRGGGRSLKLELNLRFEGREVSAHWEPRSEAFIGREVMEQTGRRRSLISGALLGAKGEGKPPRFTPATPLPCLTCCEVWRRFGGPWIPGARLRLDVQRSELIGPAL